MTDVANPTVRRLMRKEEAWKKKEEKKEKEESKEN